MRKQLAVLAIAALSAMTASADTIGSLVIGTTGATIDGTNLADSNVFTPTAIFTGTGLGDFAGIPLLTGITGGVLDLNDLGGYTVTFGAYGTFTAQLTGSSVVSQTSDFLDVFLLGNYTGDGVNITSSGPASLRISMTQSGQSVSYSGTLEAPPAAVPEPSTYALIGGSLAGLALLRRRAAR
jgi:hypothetical protein